MSLQVNWELQPEFYLVASSLLWLKRKREKCGPERKVFSPNLSTEETGVYSDGLEKIQNSWIINQLDYNIIHVWLHGHGA